MSRLIVINHITLDGVMQAPGSPDEDRRDGFEHGGWAQARPDPALGAAMGKAMANAGPFLFGRRTFEDLAAAWSHQTDGNPFTESLNTTQKYVVSTTLTEPPDWQNSMLIDGDAAAAVARLKGKATGDVIVFGSGDLLLTLMQHHLVDEYLLMIHPLVLGAGRRMFADGSTFAELQLTDVERSSSGVMIATYQPGAGSAA